MKRKIKRIASLILVAMLIASMLTGCGFAGPTQINKKHANADKPDSTSNQLCILWKDYVGGYDSDAKAIVTKYSTDERGLLMWSTKLDVNMDYGIESRDGFTFFRDVALAMYDSVFAAPYDRSTDYFCSGNKGETISLDPITVLNKTLDATVKALNLSNATITTTVNNNNQDHLRPPIYNDDFGEVNIGDIEGETVTIQNEKFGIMNTLSGVITTIKSFAMAILVAMWCIGFISQVVSERFTMETVLKTLMQLLCGIVIVENATFLVACFAQAGNTLTKDVIDGANLAQFVDFQKAMDNMLRVKSIGAFNIVFNFGFTMLGIGTIWIDGKSILAILVLLAPLITQLMCSYKILSRMIMRMLELTIRITFAPIPLAFSAREGFGSGTIKYLREILACALEPALMVVGIACVGSIFNIIKDVVLPEGATIGPLIGAVIASLSYLVLSAYLASTKSLAQEVIAR